MNRKNLTVVIISVIMISVGIGLFVYLASRPPGTSIIGENPLPVLLVHGYLEDAAIWKTWEEMLKNDQIPFYTMTFQESDDKCGSAIDHARELSNKVSGILNSTDYKHVNIVGHSKGGLDARVYLENGTKSVTNLIMIGTPNDGSPLAQKYDFCKPAIWDILPNASATKAKGNPNTNYYTIAGNWKSGNGNPNIPGPDDGLVAVSSVESQGYFQNLGHTAHQHNELLGSDEYKLARDVLMGRK